jgi:hypothetical protein
VTEQQPPENAGAPTESGGTAPSGQGTTEHTEASGTLPDIPRTVQADLARQQESVRGTVTYLLIALLAVVLIVGAIALFVGVQLWINGKDYVQIAISAVAGLLGTAMGFYFGRLQ